MNKHFLITILVVLVLTTRCFTSVMTESIQFKSEFRYVIVYNTPNDSSESFKFRTITVLLDESAFTVENLKKLNALVMKRYPQPMNSFITVFTNLEQVMTPEEIDFYGGREGATPINVNSYKQAFIKNLSSETTLTIRSSPRGDTVNVLKFPR